MKNMLIYKCLLVASIYTSISAHSNNVCKTFKDYLIINESPNCSYDPDVSSSVPDIIRRHGYPFESHETVTKDGYILNVFRIPNHNTTKERVILVHPLLASSAVFVSLGKESLAFLLADHGYDVWLPNLRGTYISEKHVNLSSKTNKYWNFSFDEMGLYDIPAVTDLVLSTTNTEKVIFFGHSMSGTILTVYASIYPEESSRNVTAIILFGPVVFLRYTKTFVALIAPLWPVILGFFTFIHDLNPFSFHGLIHKLVIFFCTQVPGNQFFCELGLMSGSGISFSQVLPAREPIIITQNFAGLSLKVLAHYAQDFLAGGRFQFYDYGPLKNKKIYHSFIPPKYPLEKIQVPFYLYYGSRDLIADKKDVLLLAKSLSPGVLAQKPKPLPFNHIDVYYGKGAPIFYQEVLQLMNNLTV